MAYYDNDNSISCALRRYIGQTVTIFTTSGGLSGSGFTGVLVSVDDCFVRLITRIGAAPDCAVGSDCGYPDKCGYGYGPYTYGYGKDGYCGNILGSITDIPIASIASFVHNAIAN